MPQGPWPHPLFRVVVLGDLATDGDPPPLRQIGEGCVGDGTAHVVEVDVDAVRAGLAHGCTEVARGPVIDAGVETELLGDVGDLVVGPGRADHPATANLRDLPDRGPDGAGRRRYEDRVTGNRPPDLEQAEVRGHARHAQNPDRCRNGRQRGIDLADLRRRGDRVVLPSEGKSLDDVAFLEGGVLAHLDAPADAAGHDAADRIGGGVRLAGAHPAAHVGVERQPEGAHEHLAVSRLGDRFLFESEVLGGGQAHGTGGEDDPAVDGHWQVPGLGGEGAPARVPCGARGSTRSAR